MAQVTQYGTISTAAGTGTDQTVSSYSVGSETNVVLVAVYTISGSGCSTDSVTFDGGAMTEVAASPRLITTGTAECSMWYKVMGSGGQSGDVVASGSGSFGSSKLVVFTLSDADQSSPIEDSDGQAPLAAQTSVSDTSDHQDNSLGIDVYVHDGSSTWSVDSGQTSLQNSYVSATIGHSSGCSEDDESGSTVTMGWSGGSQYVGHVQASFKPAANGPPTISSILGDRNQSGQIIPFSDNLTINGTNYEAMKGTGGFYLADSSTWATANKVAQTIDTWSDTQIKTRGTNVGTLLGSSQSGTLYAFVQNNTGDVSTAFTCYVAHRDVRIVHGVFETPGSTGNQDITDPRMSKVKAVIFWTTGNSSEDTSQDGYFMGMGMATTDWDISVYARSEDGVTQANANTERYRSVYGIEQTTDSGTSENRANFSSFLTNGFRLNYTVATSGRRVHYLAFCGEDVQAKIGNAVVSDGSETGLSFRPEFVWVMSFCDALADPPEAYGTMTFGCFNDSLEQQYWSCYVGNDSSDQATKSAVQDDDGTAAQVFQGSKTWEMVITSITSNGFAWSGSNSDGFDYIAFNLSGVKTKIGQITKTTATAPVSQTMPDFGFVPQGFGLVSAQRTTESAAAGDVAGNLGYFDGAGGFQSCTTVTDQNNVATLNSYHRSVDGMLLCALTESSGAVAAECYGEPIGQDQTPNIRWTTNDSNADLINYFAFEHPEAGKDKPPGPRRPAL